MSDKEEANKTFPLSTFPTGARVTKPSAVMFDFAYGRVGTVVREEVEGRSMSGVAWDGCPAAFEYPPETQFAAWKPASQTISPSVVDINYAMNRKFLYDLDVRLQDDGVRLGPTTLQKVYEAIVDYDRARGEVVEAMTSQLIERSMTEINHPVFLKRRCPNCGLDLTIV